MPAAKKAMKKTTKKASKVEKATEAKKVVGAKKAMKAMMASEEELVEKAWRFTLRVALRATWRCVLNIIGAHVK